MASNDPQQAAWPVPPDAAPFRKAADPNVKALSKMPHRVWFHLPGASERDRTTHPIRPKNLPLDMQVITCLLSGSEDGSHGRSVQSPGGPDPAQAARSASSQERTHAH